MAAPERKHTYDKAGVGEAPALVDGAAVKASAPAPVDFRTFIDPAPELETVVLHFGPSDYATIGAFFLANALGGWRFGGAVRGGEPRERKTRWPSPRGH